MKINLEIKFVFSLFIAIIVAIFAIQNAGSIEINFLWAKFSISQALVILISVIVGAVAVLLISLMNQIHQSKKIKELKKEVDSISLEREELQTIVDRINQENHGSENFIDGSGSNNYIIHEEELDSDDGLTEGNKDMEEF